MVSAAAQRRVARASWEIQITRESNGDEHGHEEDDDDLYWLRVPPEDRARLTWNLSCELYSLAARNGGVFDEETGTFVNVDGSDLERRLPRAAFVVARR
jgi:hypothetical protein